MEDFTPVSLDPCLRRGDEKNELAHLVQYHIHRDRRRKWFVPTVVAICLSTNQSLVVSTFAESIETFGLLCPIIINKNGRLIDGGRRLAAYKYLGRTEIECVVLDGDESHAEHAQDAVNHRRVRLVYGDCGSGRGFVPTENEATVLAMWRSSQSWG